MSEDVQTLKNNILYVKFEDGILYYKCVDSTGKTLSDTINWDYLSREGASDEEKPQNNELEAFKRIKATILKITSKRGHTLSQKRAFFERDKILEHRKIIFLYRFFVCYEI